MCWRRGMVGRICSRFYFTSCGGPESCCHWQLWQHEADYVSFILLSWKLVSLTAMVICSRFCSFIVIVLKAGVIDSYGNIQQVMFICHDCPESWCHWKLWQHAADYVHLSLCWKPVSLTAMATCSRLRFIYRHCLSSCCHWQLWQHAADYVSFILIVLKAGVTDSCGSMQQIMFHLSWLSWKLVLLTAVATCSRLCFIDPDCPKRWCNWQLWQHAAD